MPEYQAENTLAQLTADEQKRLEELSHSWAKADTSLFSGAAKLTAFDLKLLLLHFTPLKSLIQQLVHQTDSNTATNTDVGTGDKANSALTLAKSVSAASVDSQALEQQISQAHGINNQLGLQLQQLRCALDEQQSRNLSLENALTSAEAKLQQREHQYQQAQQALTAVNKASNHPVLQILREDDYLRGELGLNIANGAESASAEMIRTVAVLSQLDSIKRLWDLLQERCEQQQRAASQAERELLMVALNWHNYNWLQKPYKLTEPKLGQSFEFNQQQRAAFSQPMGETVQALVLPGISDHAGRLLKKALVVTTP